MQTTAKVIQAAKRAGLKLTSVQDGEPQFIGSPEQWGRFEKLALPDEPEWDEQ
jgi:hypothetical protein